MIVFDNSTSGGYFTTSSNTWSHTCTGLNQILFVMVSSNTVTVNNVKYNGTLMTFLTSANNGASYVNLYYLLNPSSGANNIVVTMSSGGSTFASASSFSNVKQTGFPDAQNTNSNSSTSISTSVTTVANNCWLLCAGFTGASDATAGANTTVRQNSGNSSRRGFIGDSNGSENPPGSYSQTVTCSSGGNAMIVVSFAPGSSLITSAVSITMMNAASRLTTLGRIAVYTRSASVSIMNAVSRFVNISIIPHILLSAPIISLRQNVAPYAVLSSLNYIKTSNAGTTLPVLNVEQSDFVSFRIYNNFNLSSRIADAVNVTVNTWDGSSHSASMAVASQSWLHIQQSGWGEGSSQPGAYTGFFGVDTRIGGYNDFMFGYSSAGTANVSDIRTGGTFGGCGFLEAKSYILPTNGSVGQLNNFVFSVKYEYII